MPNPRLPDGGSPWTEFFPEGVIDGPPGMVEPHSLD